MSDPPTRPERPQNETPAAEIPGLHGLQFTVIAVVVVAGLYLGRSVLIPITLAILLSFLLAPLVNLLRRFYLGRVPSVLISVLLALTAILALGGLIGTQLAALAEDVPAYALTIQNKVDTIQQFMASRMQVVTRSLVRQPVTVDTSAKPGPGRPASRKQAAEAAKPLEVELHQPDMTAVELARRIVTPVVEPLSTTAIVLIVSIFILLQREDLRDRMIRLFGSADLHRTTLAMNDAAYRLSRYLLTQVAINGSFGVLIAVGLGFIGIPSPMMWGVLGALLRFVPYIGAPCSAVVPLALAAAIDPGWSMLLWTAALYFVVELTIGQAVEPLLYGRSTGLSPFAVVVAATFWTWLWGAIGLILSTPLTLCLVVLGRHVPWLEFLEVLLGDQAPLTPVQSFYQRMLAGDLRAVRDQAENLLNDLPLASYYDDVVLNALRLAAIDAERGVLTPGHLARVRQAINSLIEDLDDHEDNLPAPADPPVGDPATGDRAMVAPTADGPPTTDATGGTARVLCIAGRGPLDQEAAAMLSQLLGKRGLASSVLPHSAVTRAAIGALDGAGLALVFVATVATTANPSHLRYLVRRLRVRLPRDVPVLVGFWPQGEEFSRDERLRAAVGANDEASSLREAVLKSLEAVRGATVEGRPSPVAIISAA